MKFSIIIPVYNVEEYLDVCLDSVIGQTYKNFEIIIVNDGSPDNSQDIIDKYKEKYPDIIKSYIKENGGLSDARNFAVKKAIGDYILFVDSDDYIEKKLLETINNCIANDLSNDIISYNIKMIYMSENQENKIIKKPEFYNLKGEDAIKVMVEAKNMFEPACAYAFNKKFWNENNFEFAKGKFHEDFGLIPEVIIKANKVSSINYAGYNYLQTDNSIIRNKNYNVTKQRVSDILFHFEHLIDISSKYIKNKEAQDIFNSYLANTLINQINNLKGEDRKNYIKEINVRKVFDLLLENNIKRKLKKIFVKYKYGRKI